MSTAQTEQISKRLYEGKLTAMNHHDVTDVLQIYASQIFVDILNDNTTSVLLGFDNTASLIF